MHCRLHPQIGIVTWKNQSMEKLNIDIEHKIIPSHSYDYIHFLSIQFNQKLKNRCVHIQSLRKLTTYITTLIALTLSNLFNVFSQFCLRLKLFMLLLLLGLEIVLVGTSSKHCCMVKCVFFQIHIKSSLEASCWSTFVEGIFGNRVLIAFTLYASIKILCQNFVGNMFCAHPYISYFSFVTIVSVHRIIMHKDEVLWLMFRNPPLDPPLSTIGL